MINKIKGFFRYVWDYFQNELSVIEKITTILLILAVGSTIFKYEIIAMSLAAICFVLCLIPDKTEEKLIITLKGYYEIIKQKLTKIFKK